MESFSLLQHIATISNHYFLMIKSVTFIIVDGNNYVSKKINGANYFQCKMLSCPGKDLVQ